MGPYKGRLSPSPTLSFASLCMVGELGPVRADHRGWCTHSRAGMARTDKTHNRACLNRIPALEDCHCRICGLHRAGDGFQSTLDRGLARVPRASGERRLLVAGKRPGRTSSSARDNEVEAPGSSNALRAGFGSATISVLRSADALAHPEDMARESCSQRAFVARALHRQHGLWRRPVDKGCSDVLRSSDNAASVSAVSGHGAPSPQ